MRYYDREGKMDFNQDFEVFVLFADRKEGGMR